MYHQSLMFLLLMMPHVGPMIRQYNVFYSILYTNVRGGPDGSISQVVGSNNSYKPITNTAWVRAQLCKLQKACTRLAAARDKVYQLLAQGLWFSPSTAAPPSLKLVAIMQRKVALSTNIQIQIHLQMYDVHLVCKKLRLWNRKSTLKNQHFDFQKLP